MLDYYGSIVKSEQEIDKELIETFKDRCYESYMKKIISDLRREEVLRKEYSVSGWMVFDSKIIYDIIKSQLNNELNKSEKKLKLTYCYNILFSDKDVCKMICDKI
tara:strand:- start:4340 stop:4654 length:315 start_codon:yes stop_codon:yes gene_type:complete